MKKAFFILLIIVSACKEETKDVEVSIENAATQLKPTTKKLLESLKTKGFETFDYVDEKTKDTVIMQ